MEKHLSLEKSTSVKKGSALVAKSHMPRFGWGAGEELITMQALDTAKPRTY